MPLVFLDCDGVDIGRPLTLERTPHYLRFVIRGNDSSTLDALDQLDDEAGEGETVLAAVFQSAGCVHFDGTDPKTRRRRGWTERHVYYGLCDDPPPQEVLRDTARWQAWAMSHPGAPK